MKTTGIKVKEVSAQDMLNNEAEAAYNPTEWKKGVTKMAQLKNIKFYEGEKNEHYKYSRFFVSYTLPEGLNIFTRWSPFSSMLTNNGFTRVIIVDGEIFTNGFGPNKDKVLINNKEVRKWLAENICQHGVFVSTKF